MIVINNPNLICKTVEYAGSQSVVLLLDFKKLLLGKYNLYYNSGTTKSNMSINEIVEKKL